MLPWLEIEKRLFRWALLGVAVFFGYQGLQEWLHRQTTVVNPTTPVIVQAPPIATTAGDIAAQALITHQMQLDTAAFLHALTNAPTRTAVGATTIVIPPAIPAKPTPPPGYTIAQRDFFVEAAHVGAAEALNDTHIKTTVSITQQAVAPSRFLAAAIMNGGAGFGYSAFRKGKADLDVLALFKSNVVRPGVGIGYRINGATVGIGVTTDGHRAITSLLLGYAL
jgi:hypothetical protein